MERDRELWALFRAQKTSHDPALLLEAVRVRKGELTRGVRERTRMELLLGAIALLFLALIGVAMNDVTVRLACVLLAAALVVYGVALARYGRGAEAPSPDAPVAEHFASYRQELERELAIFRRAGWYVLPVFALAVLLALSVMRFMRNAGLDARTVDTISGALGIVEFAALALGVAYGLRKRRRLAQKIAALRD